MKKIPSVFCDIDTCVFNMYMMGRKQCSLDQISRRKYCPHIQELNWKDKDVGKTKKKI